MNGRPLFRKSFVIASPPGGRDVVQQGFKPDVGNVLGIERNLDAPVDIGARNRKVIETAVDEGNNFVANTGGLDEIGLSRIEIQQLLLERAHFEEIVFFFQHLNRSRVDGAELGALKFAGSVFQIGEWFVFFTTHTIKTFVFPLINKSFVVEECQKLLDRTFVAFLRGANEIIVG